MYLKFESSSSFSIMLSLAPGEYGARMVEARDASPVWLSFPISEERDEEFVNEGKVDNRQSLVSWRMPANMLARTSLVIGSVLREMRMDITYSHPHLPPKRIAEIYRNVS
mmetsp:Transcript_30886/g.75332  ORF Transcript_30886/g.75332 Transcript_30886/m.75332 type:complete len:110 (+) Transcript_30886:193-522(+)